MYRFLVVDDDEKCRTEICDFLRGWQYYATAAKDATEALSMLKAEYFHLVIAELKLPDIDGLQLMRQIYSQFKLPVILMSADVNRNIVINARGEGAMWFILKPVIAEDFRYMWQYVLRWQNEIREEKGKGKADPDPDEDIGTSSSHRLI
ncbi:hypothetical protein DCAR_0206745 [Daucus carota subsp. sativus]|uniref:Uncharacterized protein n=1 Tax=Daucus carota subsp. sativus TaxID=79200 RepID=A0A166DEB5_DAUCS|nr:hypothetical protein DCAR_0206745 [Daucus carota subsp. sativus]